MCTHLGVLICEDEASMNYVGLLSVLLYRNKDDLISIVDMDSQISYTDG